ncbi:DUF5123 domain-containing protein [Phocaeicola sp.]
MMNIFKKISYMLGLGAVLFTVAACSDPDDELTSVTYDRLFSPTTLDAKVQNRTNVRLSWECLSEADASSYTIELFANDEAMACEGTATLSFTDVIDNPYTITALEGETTYSVRIKAVGETKESKWAVATFKTDAEQIYETVTDDDITSKSVTLNWPAGSAVTSIVISGGKDEIHTLSAAEIAAGSATISGLEYETEYTFTIMNGTKARGKVSVTTLPDYIPVYPGDDIQAEIDAAEEGSTIMLLPAKDGSTNLFVYLDEAGVETTQELIISKNISVKGLSTKPVQARIKFVLDGATGFATENITFTGVSADALIKTSNCSGAITVSGIEVSGFGNFVVDPGETACKVDEFTVTNSYFHDMCTGKRFIDSQKKKCAIMTFNMKNCTVANSCSGSDFIRFDYNSAAAGMVINFENNTLYKVEATSKGLFYIRSGSAGDKAFTANIKNNVFAELGAGVYFSQDTKTDNLVFSNNNYYNTPSLLANPDGGAGKVFDTTGSSLNPEFKDAANGDFTLTNATLIDKNIGDLHW